MSAKRIATSFPFRKPTASLTNANSASGPTDKCCYPQAARREADREELTEVDEGVGATSTCSDTTDPLGPRGGEQLAVLFGDVVLEDADGGGPFERSVGSVVIVEVDEPFIGAGALDV